MVLLFIKAAFLGETRNAYNILVREPGGKRPFGVHRCEDIIKMDLTEIG
jgi:hypothetical protein